MGPAGAGPFFPYTLLMNKTPADEIMDSTPMPFGKYRGKAMIEVPAKYLLWLHDNHCDHDAVRKYINDNLQALRKEAGITRR